MYKTFFLNEGHSSPVSYDYSVQDSLFFADGDNQGINDDNKQELISVDYKQEVLDFNESNFTGEITKVTPAENSININSADLNELVLLPGIGNKTAERIIEYRNKKGKFNSLNELLEIKGIGQAKLNSIVKYLFID
jgi:competence protein ComEA